MEFFHNARSVRLKTSHGFFLFADNDGKSVILNRRGCSPSVDWIVQVLGGNFIRLKSCYGNYLTASHDHLPFNTGLKVVQSTPDSIEGSAVWEPYFDNGGIRLRSTEGSLLKASQGLPPPWHNFVAHGIPPKATPHDSASWEIEVVEFIPPESPPPQNYDSADLHSPARSHSSNSPSDEESQCDSLEHDEALEISEEREITVHFKFSERGKIHEALGEFTINFKGSSVVELLWKIEEELGIHGIALCRRSPVDGKLLPLPLRLTGYTSTITGVVVLLPPRALP